MRSHVCGHVQAAMETRRAGFTLVQIVLCVAILLMLAIYAVPSLTDSLVMGQEGHAQAALRTIQEGAEGYWTDHQTYPSSLDDLVEATPPYVPEFLADGEASGYVFTIAPQDNGTIAVGDQEIVVAYLITAAPANEDSHARVFTLDSGGVLQFDASVTNSPDLAESPTPDEGGDSPPADDTPPVIIAADPDTDFTLVAGDAATQPVGDTNTLDASQPADDSSAAAFTAGGDNTLSLGGP